MQDAHEETARGGVVRLTHEAARRLAASHGEGRVRSVHRSAVNVELSGDEADDLRVVSLHGPGPLPSPFGVALAALPARLTEGAVVRVGAGVLAVGGARIPISSATVVDTSVPAGPPAPDPARVVARALAGGPAARGLLPAAAAALSVGPQPVDLLSRLAAPMVARLVEATAAARGSDGPAAAVRLLGLGPGLTPSGDDLVAGWLVALRASGSGLAGTLAPRLLVEAAARTGWLSRACLAAAARGALSETVLAFVRRPADATLDALLALGATSGADFLAGYLVGRAAPGAARAAA